MRLPFHIENWQHGPLTRHSPHLNCPGPSLYVHLYSAHSWWQRAVCPHCGTKAHKIQSITVIQPNPSASDNNPARWRICSYHTCSMSSQSSLPTKIISLGRRWRVPPPLTRNQEVRLISAPLAHLWPRRPLMHPAESKHQIASTLRSSYYIKSGPNGHGCCCFMQLLGKYHTSVSMHVLVCMDSSYFCYQPEDTDMLITSSSATNHVKEQTSCHSLQKCRHPSELLDRWILKMLKKRRIIFSKEKEKKAACRHLWARPLKW